MDNAPNVLRIYVRWRLEAQNLTILQK